VANTPRLVAIADRAAALEPLVPVVRALRLTTGKRRPLPRQLPKVLLPTGESAC
jgi:hypothetical protein